jgi:hypothetical protein
MCMFYQFYTSFNWDRYSFALQGLIKNISHMGNEAKDDRSNDFWTVNGARADHET